MSDDLEKIIRPIVEGQIRGFIKEHPSILRGVDWYKPGKDKALTLTGSLSKRIVRDLLSHASRQRIEAALARSTGEPQTSAVESWTAAEVAQRGIATALGGQPRTVILAL
ncbi:MAG: hypothetical protein KIT15_17005 [Xanthobacteraceae bacterium]|nr:hypothetical protein [Xanthobacteraceae bacterium]